MSLQERAHVEGQFGLAGCFVCVVVVHEWRGVSDTSMMKSQVFVHMRPTWLDVNRGVVFVDGLDDVDLEH